MDVCRVQNPNRGASTYQRDTGSGVSRQKEPSGANSETESEDNGKNSRWRRNGAEKGGSLGVEEGSGSSKGRKSGGQNGSGSEEPAAKGSDSKEEVDTDDDDEEGYMKKVSRYSVGQPGWSRNTCTPATHFVVRFSPEESVLVAPAVLKLLCWSTHHDAGCCFPHPQAFHLYQAKLEN